MYQRPHTEPVRRRGVALLLVLLMLTLFAILGLAFVLYANSAADAARIHREAESLRQPDLEPELAFSYFLGQLLYDCLDDEQGVYSALRGHSLLRNMYGLNYDSVAGQWTLGDNYVGYNGAGRLHYPGPFGIDDSNLINYQYFPSDGFLRDPERYGTRANLGQARGPYVGANVSYTYPDVNNLFLAAVKADGTVLLPSFHRPWAGFGPLGPQNPNWYDAKSPSLKYLVLRPRPVDMGPGFPPTEDDGGDVKNLVGSPGGNDSMWIDLDFPVLTGPDGRLFKPLFAPLIVDLDGRVNVNAHGNILGTNSDHCSNQGLGPWEVNPGKVLNADANEWKNLLLGKPPTGTSSRPGRLGANRQSANGGPAPYPYSRAGRLYGPHHYAPVDFDGRDETTGASTGRMQLPAAGGDAVLAFPTFPRPGYGNASLRERTGHPLLYDPLKPATYDANNDDYLFSPSNMSRLLHGLDTGGQALTSELASFCPLNLSDSRDVAGAVRRGRMLTTISFDLDRPGVVPWLWHPPGLDTAYKYDPALGLPHGGPIPFPDPALRAQPPAPENPFTNSEFSPGGWQAVSPTPDMSRLNLYRPLRPYQPDPAKSAFPNRPLRPYPAPDPDTGYITDVDGFVAAQQDRQDLAADIFRRLCKVTGSPDPATPMLDPNTADFASLRWLAQLAVNLVDFIDADDYMTPFRWRVGVRGRDQWVFGTELPRLVLNEAYVQNHTEGENQRVTAWVELLNPLSPSPEQPDNGDPTLTNNGDAVLQIGPYAVYQVALVEKEPFLRDPANVAGNTRPARIKAIVGAWSDPNADPDTDSKGPVVKPSNGRYASNATDGTEGFYVVGPAGVAFPRGADPMLPASFLSPGMTYASFRAAQPPTILLRRLACPHLPPNFVRGDPLYNPYITVDYMEDVPINDSALAVRASWGRNQPYAAHISQRAAQNPATASQPLHTFFRHNAPEDPPGPPTVADGQTLRVPFDWLVHLDRPPVSPIELLHVSAYKPHELTQQFVAPTLADPTQIAPFQHYAPWVQPETRISRLLAFLETSPPLFDRLYDTPPKPPDSLFDRATGRRVPGRINLNTIWDEEVFQALCDAAPSNSFTAADVRTAFQHLLDWRTPGGVPDGADHPLLDLSTGYTASGDRQYPDGVSVLNTILRPGLFDLPDPDPTTRRPRHPYQKLELLSKIFNSTTVRSNIFAVWVTVGFFEVTDATTRPMKLGPEVGRAEARHVRHRMFAIVDRTNAKVFDLHTEEDLSPPGSVVFEGGADAFSGMTPGGLRWELKQGGPLVFDPNTGREETTLLGEIPSSLPSPARIPVNLTRPYPVNTPVVGRGNPGPWQRYDPRRDTAVVPYWTVIN